LLQAFRCAGLAAQQQPNIDLTREQSQANLEILRNMANDLIEQYFLPTVRQFLKNNSFCETRTKRNVEI